MLSINASIVQGSGIGPSSYVINCCDLNPINPDNKFSKYADDTYLVVPSSNSNSITMEMQSISRWASANNLKLNENKSKEMIVRWPRSSQKSFQPPEPFPGIERVGKLNVLGVCLSDSLSFGEHVNSLLTQASGTVYALRILRSNGLTPPALWDVTYATLIARLSYASPAWWGFVDANSKQRLQALFKKLIKQGFLSPNLGTFNELCSLADQKLFESIINNHNHVLHHLLPPVKVQHYDLRSQPHNRILPIINQERSKQNFLKRMLYSDIY
jgi:hypothetical protein